MKKDLELLSKFAGNRTVTVCDNVYLKDGIITSTNLETFCQVRTDIKGEGLIPLAQLKKIVAKNNIDSVNFVGDVVQIHSGRNVFKYKTDEIDTFPNIPNRGEYLFTFTIDKEFMGLKKFVGKDKLRPAMTGVYFSDDGHIVATDAYKMKWLNRCVKGEIILPVSIFNLPQGEYKVYRNDYWVCLESLDVTTFVRIIDAIFPSYKVVIPSNTSASMTVDKKHIIDLIDNALLCANQTSLFGEINTSVGKLMAEDLDTESVFEGEIFGGFVNEIRIGVNLRLLREVVDAEISDSVTINFSSPSQPMVVNDKALLMSLRIQ